MVKIHNTFSVLTPLGLFYLDSNGRFVAIDNNSGEAFVEEFQDKEEDRMLILDDWGFGDDIDGFKENI